MAGTPAQNGNNEAGNNDSSRKTVELAGWPTPNLNERGAELDKSNRPNSGGIDLQSTAQLANHSGLATPTTRDYRSESASDEYNKKRWTHPRGKPLSAEVTMVTGSISMSSTAETAKAAASQRPVLNPAFSAWLMGYSLEWILSGIKGIRSHGKRLKAALRSSKESATPSTHTSQQSS